MTRILQWIGLSLWLLPWNLQGLNFTIQDLGTLSTEGSKASGINQHNVVVGSVKKADIQTHFMWTQDEGHIPLSFTNRFQSPLINNHDEIVGISWHHTNYWFSNNKHTKSLHILTTDGEDQSIGIPDQWKIQELSDWDWEWYSEHKSDYKDTKDLVILAFNDQQQILLTNSHNSNKANQFVVWQNGLFKKIPSTTLKIAYGMNNQGIILGRRWVKTENGNIPMLVLYDINQGTLTEIMKDINIIKREINDRGQVIVTQMSKDQESLEGLLWDPQNGITRFDDFAPIVFNNRNQMIGLKISELLNKKSVWLFWDDGKIMDLNQTLRIGKIESLWTSIESFKAMNDNGYAIGEGKCDDKEHAFILIPSTHE